MSRLLIVSHPCVVTANQAVYVALQRLGWHVDLVVPASWSHEYAPDGFRPVPAPELVSGFHPLRVLNAGRPQRHVYVAHLARVIRRARPDVAFVEEETFSNAAHQWGRALAAARIPFGLQADENLDRRLHAVARINQKSSLRRASFVAARSPRARTLVERSQPIATYVIPHAVPAWDVRPTAAGARPYTIGFAGRLLREKGVFDLVTAVNDMRGSVRLRLVGDGPLREALLETGSGDPSIEVVTGVPHERMAEQYAQMDVLVLPSRTTPTWAEQFGRVLVEAMWCGVPVIGSDSGEIPWVVTSTGGGLLFPEGDAEALREALERLRDPKLRASLARTGRRAVEERFGVESAARRLDEVLRALLPASAPHT